MRSVKAAIFSGRSPVGIAATRFAQPAKAGTPFFTDLAPTILEVGGVELVEGMTGRSFLTVLLGKSVESQKVCFQRTQLAFYDLVAQDEVLRPFCRKWLDDTRGKDFGIEIFGGTLATTERLYIDAGLVEVLLDAGKEEQMHCFSRLFKRVAEEVDK